ncbi:hypothetical protein JCM11641_002377 [Rhodosporidiobolus odoratus]
MSRSARSSRRRSTTSRRSSPASSPPLSLYSSDFSENENVPAYTQRDRYLSKPEFVPAIPDSPSSTSSSDSELDGKGLDTAAARRMSNPLDPLRRGNCMLQLFGAGALALGSTLVVALYVTGPPRMHDIASASTAVLFMTLFLGCAACVPSWAAALLILLGKKPKPNEPPPHGKLLRLAALCSFFLATLYSVATLVLFVLLQTEESFVSFCLRNISSATKEDCEDRWNRDWVMGLVVGIVWIFHTALGFPIYRYTRGTDETAFVHANMSGLPLNSGDLKGKPSRRSPLSLHNSPRTGTSDNESVRSPASPAFYSPNSQLGAPPSPFLDSNFNHFSTLPPSPPLAASTDGPSVPPLRSPMYSAYPTPPASVPGSARSRAGFEAVNMGGDSPSSVLLGEDLNTDSSAKRRPSLILTSAPAEEPQGLAIGIDTGDPLPSPLFKRSFSGSTSPLNSPTIPQSSFFSTSPANSPVLGSFPSPRLAAGSPTFGSSATMEQAPSSPRLSTLTDPLGRFATGLVRRASSNALDAELPTSVKRTKSSQGITRSPTLTAPSLSPSLGGGSVRRTSFAAAARGKELEKEKEVKDREEKKRAEKFHNRMFSWADRPGDFLGKPKTGTGRRIGFRKRAVFIGVLALCALVVVYRATDTTVEEKRPTPTSTLEERAARAARAKLGPRLRRPPAAGRQFIHPEVVERQAAPVTSWLGAPYRWGPRLLGAGKAKLPAGYRQPSVSRRKTADKASPTERTEREAKRRSVFVPKKHIEFVDHQALPPPPEHGDEPQRDTLVLYRILGNDLPPRHSPGQTLRNLRFLLQHESDFSILPPLGPHGIHHSHLYGSGSKAKEAHTQMGGLRVDKYFVLNRIAEPEMVSAIIGLLHLYSVPDSRILVIPFEWSEYQRREFRWDGGVDSANGWTIGDGPHLQASFGKITWTPVPGGIKTPDDLSVLLEEADGEEARAAAAKKKKSETLGRLRALDFTYHEKNLYAMNNNGGRNFALQHGRSLPNARWILPLDGNSFFTPAAMYSIVRTLSITGEGAAASRYVVIPMARLLDNSDVRKNNSVSLIPLDAVEEGASAIVESEIHHRPQHAPDTPEEPQVGFRYDSTETFQEAMRYGRRSKLELLWRLGAIPYSRGLDRRTLPWEVTDRAHITAKTWGSIPGVDGAETKDSIIHAPHGEHDPWGEPNPDRGPLAYVKAGWVYRLFSGHKLQEEHSSEAVTLRNANRIRGIVAFLERLDEKVARGEHGCFDAEDNPFLCGYRADRLWNFDQTAMERLRQKYKLGRRDAVQKVERFEQLISPTTLSVAKALKAPVQVADLDAQKAATDSALLAMAAYLTGNSTYTSYSAGLIAQRFVKRTPLFYHRVNHNEQVSRMQEGEEGEQPPADDGKDVVGYAFPPLPKEPGQPGSWSADLAMRLVEANAPALPYDPLEFDPLLLLDAVRLLNHPNIPGSEQATPAARKAITPLVKSHLSWLLFAPEALKHSRQPPSAEDGALYDAKVAALAAFLDDARLLGRVANRARLRLPSSTRAEGLMDPATEVREIHFRLLQGLSNLKLRPYNLVSGDRSFFMGATHGQETPLDVLGV